MVSNFTKKIFWKWSLWQALQHAKKIFRYEKILGTFFETEISFLTKPPNQLAPTLNFISTNKHRQNEPWTIIWVSIFLFGKIPTLST